VSELHNALIQVLQSSETILHHNNNQLKSLHYFRFLIKINRSDAIRNYQFFLFAGGETASNDELTLKINAYMHKIK